jgi:hypothetical protein
MEQNMICRLAETKSRVVAQTVRRADHRLQSVIVNLFAATALFCTIVQISEAAVAGETSTVVRECKPKRAILKIDYKPLELQLPRVLPVGDLKLAFVVSREGKAVDIRTVWSRSDWPSWDTAAMTVLSGAQFDPPTEPCRQTMRFKFKLGK